MTDEPLERVRITSPRTAAPRPRSRSRSRPSKAAEIDAQTRLGEVYVQSLIRAQLRLAGYVVLALALSLGILPVALRALPAGGVHLMGVPLPWLVLGIGVYPWILVLAWWYVGRAEHNEEAFEDIVNRPEGP